MLGQSSIAVPFLMEIVLIFLLALMIVPRLRLITQIECNHFSGGFHLRNCSFSFNILHWLLSKAVKRLMLIKCRFQSSWQKLAKLSIPQEFHCTQSVGQADLEDALRHKWPSQFQ